MFENAATEGDGLTIYYVADIYVVVACIFFILLMLFYYKEAELGQIFPFMKNKKAEE